MPRYAISDIHGCLSTFQRLLKKLDFQRGDTLYLLGDYIDRGPDSKGVIDFIWELQEEGYNVHCLKGNHEVLALDNSIVYAGGYYDHAFLESFGVRNYQTVPIKYYDWMRNLPHFFEIDQYILAHAGLNTQAANPLDDLSSMLWIRNWRDDINEQWLGSRTIVHGHTPISKRTIEQQLSQLSAISALDIDGGCVFGHLKHLGYLAAYDLDQQALTFQRSLE